MKKLLLLIAFLAVLTTSLFAQELPRLAVVEFRTNINNERTGADAVTIRNLVESQMVRTGQYQIIAREEIDRLLENQRIQASEISSAENIQRLQLQNISYIVTGSIDAMGEFYAITVRILNVATGQFSHSDNDLMGSAPRDLFNGINTLMTRFVAGMSADESGTIVQGQVRASAVDTGISIEVTTRNGGILYFQGNEIASLWDNDTYSIPIERPGTYTVKMVFGNGSEDSRSVAIASRGVTRIDFINYAIGDTGPAGGIVFYDKGNSNDGWRYLEAAPASSEFRATWGSTNTNVSTGTAIGTGRQNTRNITTSGSAAQRCLQLNINGFSDWFLPSRDELNLMYVNLAQRGLGGFRTTVDNTNYTHWYWSSSQANISNAWVQGFSSGNQYSDYKGNTSSVRAIRAF